MESEDNGQCAHKTHEGISDYELLHRGEQAVLHDGGEGLCTSVQIPVARQKGKLPMIKYTLSSFQDYIFY